LKDKKSTTFSSRELALIIGLAVIVIAGITAWLILRKRRTGRLRTQFGGAEYERAVKEDGSRRHAEAGLKERTQRVESLNIRPLASGDRARSWIRGAEFSRGSLTVPVGRSRRPINCYAM
jgi:hypothetical protein